MESGEPMCHASPASARPPASERGRLNGPIGRRRTRCGVVGCLLLLVAVSTLGSPQRGGRGPSLSETKQYLNNMAVGKSTGIVDHSLSFAQDLNWQQTIQRADHDCDQVHFYMQPADWGGDRIYRYVEWAFRPREVTVEWTQNSLNVSFVCVQQPGCIQATMDVNNTVTTIHAGTAYIQLFEPSQHRYVNAFLHLQELCGGVEKNPFD